MNPIRGEGGWCIIEDGEGRMVELKIEPGTLIVRPIPTVDGVVVLHTKAGDYQGEYRSVRDFKLELDKAAKKAARDQPSTGPLNRRGRRR